MRMKKEGRYDKAVRILKENNPELSDTTKLVDRVMEGIGYPSRGHSDRKKIETYLFGWSGHQWARAAMSIAALFFLCFFLIQQFEMRKRLITLEEQLVTHSFDNAVRGKDPGTLHRTLVKMALEDRSTGDSITVLRDDMEALLNDYLQLVERLEYLDPAYNHESRMKMMLRKRAETNAELKKSI